MAQILITNYTGTVTSDIVVCEANPGPTIGTCYNLATLYGTSGQISPTTTLPAWYTLPNNFDYDSFCYIQLSASTTLFTVPQLIQCGIEPPGTWGFESCGQPLDKNIYVFYDTSGSYPDGVVSGGTSGETLSGASVSIRNWYYDLVNNSGYTGQLYEIPVVNERFINWPCYPYLGSTTGGTLSDSSTVQIEMGSVTYSTGLNGSVTSSQVVRRIALGLDLGTGNPLPSTPGYSSGVPFDHNNYTLSGCQLATLPTQDTNYISIIVLNESAVMSTPDGCSFQGSNYIQGYFFVSPGVTSFDSISNTSPVLNPNNPQPFIKVPTPCGAYSPYTSGAYSGSSIQRDYESWIKVWNDVNVNLNGFAKSFLFPVPTARVTYSGGLLAAGQALGFGTLYQSIEIIEGEIPQAPSYFQSEYCDGAFSSTGSQWPYPNQRYNNYSASTLGQFYDFTPLSYYNSFTGFTATTAYQNLPTQYKNGPGLKNFGWSVDATITAFTQSLVTNDLNNYLSSILSGTKIYTTTQPLGINEGNIYTIQDFEGCWTYNGYRLDGQPAYVNLETIDEFTNCDECNGNPSPLIVQFKYNGFCATYSAPGYITTGSTSNPLDQIVVIGYPNDDVDITIQWPFPIGTDLPSSTFSIYDTNALTWTTYPLGVNTGFTTTLNSSGVNVLEYKMIGAGYGFEFIKFDITATTQGAAILDTQEQLSLSTDPSVPLPLSAYTCISFVQLPAPGETAYMMVVGFSSVSEVTSGTACTNYAVQKSYLINPAPQSQTLDYILDNYLTTSFRFSDAQTLVPINGGNNWIAISNCQYTVYGYTMNKIAIQVDSSGYIINAEQC